MKIDRHEEDREYLHSLREMGDAELAVYLRFQASEPWRRIAIEREIARRQKNMGL